MNDYELDEQIDEICGRFEAAWQGKARPHVEDYLAEVDATKRETLLYWLLVQDIGYKCKQGVSVNASDYLERFPDFHEAIHDAFRQAAKLGKAEADDATSGKGPQQSAMADISGGGADRNLLFGILALQLDFISRDALVAAMNAWVLEKSKPIGVILTDQGNLSAQHHELLNALVAEHLKQHADDPQRSLQSLSSIRSVRDDLRAVVDPEIQASLGHVSLARANDSSFPTTIDLGQTSSAGSRFRLLRPHAKGGLGEVFVAKDAELNREVALKQIQDSFADNANLRARFTQEAEITGGLEHPGIVPVYGLGQYDNGRPFYAMRMVRGASLKEAIREFHASSDRKFDSIAFRKLLGRFMDVCDAIQYAHSRGVLHRDLKPGNIMLGKFGETLVVDWGLAKATGQRDRVGNTDEDTLLPASGSGSAPTAMGAAFGTPGYMSPEQAAGRVDELGAATDVFSLGATLYCVLTGKAPFEGDDVAEILNNTKQGRFEPPRAVDRNIPKSLEAICVKAMAHERSDRYESPAELRDDAEAWLADEPVTAHRESLSYRTRRFMRRHKNATFATAVAIVLVAVVSMVALTIVESARRGEAWERKLKDQANIALGQTNADLTESNSNLAVAIKAADAEATEAGRQATLAQEAQRLSEKALRISDTRHYHTQITTAHFAWDAGEIAAAANHLSECRFKQRGWEHGYLTALCEGSLKTLIGNSGSITSVAFSPDGKRIVSSSEGATFKLWDVETGAEVLALDEPVSLQNLIFSPDGKRIAGAGLTMNRFLSWEFILIWNLESGHNPLKIRCYDETVSFSPDGNWIVSSRRNDYGFPTVWNATTGESVLELKVAANDAVFSRDGKLIIASTADHEIKSWDAMTGKEAKLPGEVVVRGVSPDGERLLSVGKDNSFLSWRDVTDTDVASFEGLQARVRNASFSPDGNRIAAGMQDNTIAMWNGTTRRRLLTLKGHTAEIRCVAFSPDGLRIVSGSDDQTIKLWDVSANQQTIHCKPPSYGVRSVAFSPDGQSFVSADYTTTLFSTKDGRQLKSLGNYATCVAFDPDGKRIVTGNAYGVHVWDVASGWEIFQSTKAAKSVAFSPHGEWIVSGNEDGSITLWNSMTLDELRTLNGHDGGVECVAFSPDGQMIASGGKDKTVKLWDARTGAELRTFLGHDGDVNAIAIDPNGKLIASGSNDKSIKLWNAETAEEVRTFEGHSAEVTTVVFGPHGQQIISGSRDESIRVWDVETGKELSLFESHADSVTSLAFNPVVNKIVSGSDDGEIKLWNATNVRETHSIRSHDIIGLAVSPVGDSLATAGSGTIKVWDLSTGQESFSFTADATCIAFSPDGKRIVSGSQGAIVRLWDVSNGNAIRAFDAHMDTVNAVAFSANGDLIVSASNDGTAKVWDVVTGHEVCTLRGHKDSVTCVTFTADDKRIITGSADHTLVIWDAVSGKQLKQLTGHRSAVKSVSCTPDGNRVVSAGDATIRTWDTNTGDRLLTLEYKPSSKVTLSPDGLRIVFGSGDKVVVLDSSTGIELFAHNIDRGPSAPIVAFTADGECLITCHAGAIMVWRATTRHSRTIKRSATSVAFSADGKWIACGDVGTITLVDTHTEETRTLFGSTPAVTSIQFSFDGQHLVAGSADGTVRLWNVEAGEVIRELVSHPKEVRSVAFNPVGNLIVSGSDDGMINVCDASTGKRIHTFLGKGRAVKSVAFSPDGNRILCGRAETADDGSDDVICVWDVTTGAETLMPGFRNLTSNVAYSPDGELIVSAGYDGTITLRDGKNGSTLQTLESHRGPIECVAFSPTGKRIISGGSDRVLTIWDVRTGMESHNLTGQVPGVRSVSFGANEKQLVSLSGGGTVELWSVPETLAGPAKAAQALLDTAEAERTLLDQAVGRVLEGHTDRVLSVAFSPDGSTLVSGSSDKLIKVWNVATEKNSATLKGHLGGVSCLAVSPDGTTVASGSDDKTIKLWALKSGELKLTLTGHTDAVRSVCLSPDGKMLASGSVDNTTRLWDIDTGTCTYVLTNNSIQVAFHPNGQTLATLTEPSDLWLGSDDGSIRLWDVKTGEQQTCKIADDCFYGGLFFLPDRKTVLAVGPPWLNIFDLATGNQVASNLIEEFHIFSSAMEPSLALSPNGKRVAVSAPGYRLDTSDGKQVGVTNAEKTMSISERDLAPGESKTISVLDVATGERVGLLKGHTDTVNAVAFSPDGRTLASGSSDKTIRLWTVATEK